jgi:hypothetical protein
MNKCCFYIAVLFAISISAKAQIRTDTTIHKFSNDSLKYFSLHVLPSNYYSSNLSFFCKKELQVQNALKVPLRFRLGSVAYCDAMEGKNNSHP